MLQPLPDTARGSPRSHCAENEAVCVHLRPASQVWKVLSELDSIHLWVAAITHSHCPGQQRRGVGAMSQTLVTSSAEVVMKGGRARRYFVEHGEPFLGPVSEIPLAPAVC